jgi:hypothetical protein
MTRIFKDDTIICRDPSRALWRRHDRDWSEAGMDGRRFDGVIRSLGAARGRRGVVRGLASAALLGAAAVLGRAPGAAAAPVGVEDTRREFQRRCESRSQCQGGNSACRRIEDSPCGGASVNGIFFCKRCNLDGRRCCGTVGSSCRQNSCNCCGDLICDFETNKCTEPPTVE